MKLIKTPVKDCFEIIIERLGDDRGYFARTFCERELAAAGLSIPLAQASISFSAQKGTTRGLHFQSHPAMESKLVQCLKGAIFDVMVDIRPGSPTFGHWYGAELSEENNTQLYSPKGFAHGFQTLTDNTLVSYHIDAFYDPDLTNGCAWNDPDIAIKWPIEPTVQSDRDLALPKLVDVPANFLLPYGAE